MTSENTEPETPKSRPEKPNSDWFDGLTQEEYEFLVDKANALNYPPTLTWLNFRNMVHNFRVQKGLPGLPGSEPTDKSEPVTRSDE